MIWAAYQAGAAGGYVCVGPIFSGDDSNWGLLGGRTSIWCGQYPLQVRVILSALLGVVVMGYVPVPTVDSFNELQILGVIVTELVVGLSAGLIITIWFSAAVLAGEKDCDLCWLRLCCSD